MTERGIFERLAILMKNSCKYVYHYQCPVHDHHSGWYSVPMKGVLKKCCGNHIEKCGAMMEFTGMRVEKETGPRGEVLKDWRPLVSRLWKIRMECTLVFHEEKLDEMVDNGSISYFGPGMDPDYKDGGNDE